MKANGLMYTLLNGSDTDLLTIGQQMGVVITGVVWDGSGGWGATEVGLI